MWMKNGADFQHKLIANCSGDLLEELKKEPDEEASVYGESAGRAALH